MSPEGERRYGNEGGSWRRWVPTWRGMAPHEGTCASAVGRTGGWRKMESSREPFMAPLGHCPSGNIGERRVTKGNIPLGIFMLQGKCTHKVVQRRME
jgi:hypothetical protein